jgi:hypothetical protein
MSKNDHKKNRTLANKQDKLRNAENSVPGTSDIQNHNAKKVALGPNTKR